MDAIEKLKADLREGRVKPERLLDLIVDLQNDLRKAHQRIKELEQKFGGSVTSKVDEPYSTKAEEKRQEERGKTKKKKSKGRRGRISNQEKLAMAHRTESVFPVGVPESD